MNAKYPVTMRKSIAYSECNEEILSLTILENRWKLFGHTLQLHKDTPAQKSMKLFFTESKAFRLRGKPRINLSQKLDDDLAQYINCGVTLKANGDLEKLTELAQDREMERTDRSDL